VVRVRIRAGGAHVRIEVADDGPGLPMSVTALTASARARRGRRGHGLAIAAAIAEHHGGRLHAAPSDAGARLMLEMPAANEPVVA
jgi:signal transduction histidine kinase